MVTWSGKRGCTNIKRIIVTFFSLEDKPNIKVVKSVWGGKYTFGVLSFRRVTCVEGHACTRRCAAVTRPDVCFLPDRPTMCHFDPVFVKKAFKPDVM